MNAVRYMRGWQAVCVRLLFAAVTCLLLSACEDTQQAHERGRQEGHAQGYEEGKQKGFEDGKEAGINEGFAKGQEVGKAFGYVLGSGTFFYDHMIPSLGCSLLVAAALVMIWMAVCLARLLLFPPFRAVVVWIRDQVLHKWTLRQAKRSLARARRQARVQHAKHENRIEVSTALARANITYQIHAAGLTENAKLMFEKLIDDLELAVSQERRAGRQAFDDQYAVLSEYIDAQRGLDAEAKSVLQRELFAQYSSLLKPESSPASSFTSTQSQLTLQ